MIPQITRLYAAEMTNSNRAVFTPRSSFPAPTFCPTIAASALCKATFGRIKMTLILAAMPTAADAYTPRRLAMPIRNTRDTFKMVF